MHPAVAATFQLPLGSHCPVDSKCQARVEEEAPPVSELDHEGVPFHPGPRDVVGETKLLDGLGLGVVAGTGEHPVQASLFAVSVDGIFPCEQFFFGLVCRILLCCS